MHPRSYCTFQGNFLSQAYWSPLEMFFGLPRALIHVITSGPSQTHFRTPGQSQGPKVSGGFNLKTKWVFRSRIGKTGKTVQLWTLRAGVSPDSESCRVGWGTCMTQFFLIFIKRFSRYKKSNLSTSCSLIVPKEPNLNSRGPLPGHDLSFQVP